MQYSDDPRAWHQWWKQILRRGRSPKPVPGRLFTGKSPQQDADEWADYMKHLRSWKEPTEWEPLPSTYGEDDQIDFQLKLIKIREAQPKQPKPPHHEVLSGCLQA